MKTTTTVTETFTDHPLEDFLGIESNSTAISRVEQNTELVKAVEYDEKDEEIEQTYQTIFDKAMTGYENLQDELDSAEGKYIPRIAEVGAVYLQLALNSADAKAKLKQHKDKLVKKISSPKTVNNTVIMNREDLLQSIKNTNTISAEFVEIQENINDKE